MATRCALEARVQQLATEKNLTPPFCPVELAALCNGLRCLWMQSLEENPPYLTIYLPQEGPKIITAEERFFARLEKTAKIIGI